MTPAQFRTLGEALYAPNVWQRAVARELGKNERQVRRWVAGDAAIPDEVSAWMVRRCHAHAQRLLKLARLHTA